MNSNSATRAFLRRAARSLGLIVGPSTVVLVVAIWSLPLACFLHAGVALPALAGWLFAIPSIWEAAIGEAGNPRSQDVALLTRVAQLMALGSAAALALLIFIPGNGWVRMDLGAWVGGGLAATAMAARAARTAAVEHLSRQGAKPPTGTARR